MRNAVNQASNAYDQARDTANNYEDQSQVIAGRLTPFLTEEMLHPEGIGQQGLSAETAAAEGGAGGATSGFTGQAVQRAAASRNGGAIQATLDDLARSRAKAAAGASEGIAADNERLKQQQQQEGAAGLGKLYGTDTGALTDLMGQESRDIDAGVNANNSGWLQNASSLIRALNGAGMKNAQGGGFTL